MCSLPLLCTGSFSPIQTASDNSLHQGQNFPVNVGLRNCHKFCAPTFFAIQTLSSHHSIHRNSSHHQTRTCQRKNCQCDTSVQIPESLNFVSDCGFSKTRQTMFRGFTLSRTSDTFGTFGTMGVKKTIKTSKKHETSQKNSTTCNFEQKEFFLIEKG